MRLIQTGHKEVGTCAAEAHTRPENHLWQVHLCATHLVFILQHGNIHFALFSFAEFPYIQQYVGAVFAGVALAALQGGKMAFAMRGKRHRLVWVVSESLLLVVSLASFISRN